MRRGTTGRYHSTTAGTETVRAFIPHPLPPAPPLELGGPLHRLLEEALLSVGRLDAVSTLLPSTHFFLYSYVRKEALLSSQIEGTQSSLSELFLFELEDAQSVSTDDVVEVSNYVAAMEHGLRRLEEGFPLSNRLLREIHGVLLRSGRGNTRDPGQFRRSQNWIGGTRPGNATFVPPPVSEVPAAMSDLEQFLHGDADGLPVLIRAALAHVQFETIHPFLDGNGRVGRLLVTLYLCQAEVLRDPLLYLSLYLKQHRQRYYELLDSVRRDGDWEEWLQFFLEGVRETAETAVGTVRRLDELFRADRDRLKESGRRAGSQLRVHEVMKERPVLSIQRVAELSGLSFPTAASVCEDLVTLGMVKELTGRKRARVYAYAAYLDILSEGTEPL